MKFHPLSELFPPLSGPELSDLATDIKRNGQQVPIIVFDGQILDGRNRFLACREAKVKPTFKKFRGDPSKLVESLNIKRRHLNESQRALLAAELIKLSEGSKDPVSKEEAATKLNTSAPTLKRAMRVVKTGSKELKRSVARGKVPVTAAERIARLPKSKQAAAMKSREREMKSPRGGLAAEAKKDKPFNPVIAPGARVDTKEIRKDVLAAMDAWWKDNKETMSSYPPANPSVVFNGVRKVVENAL